MLLLLKWEARSVPRPVSSSPQPSPPPQPHLHHLPLRSPRRPSPPHPPDALLLKLLLVLGAVDLLEDLHEPPVVLLQDRVLGRQVQRPVCTRGGRWVGGGRCNCAVGWLWRYRETRVEMLRRSALGQRSAALRCAGPRWPPSSLSHWLAGSPLAGQGVLEARLGKAHDGLLGIVHAHAHARPCSGGGGGGVNGSSNGRSSSGSSMGVASSGMTWVAELHSYGAQHSTARHSTARHGTARHGTARHCAPPHPPLKS